MLLKYILTICPTIISSVFRSDIITKLLVNAYVIGHKTFRLHIFPINVHQGGDIKYSEPVPFLK